MMSSWDQDLIVLVSIWYSNDNKLIYVDSTVQLTVIYLTCDLKKTKGQIL